METWKMEICSEDYKRLQFSETSRRSQTKCLVLSHSYFKTFFKF
jgi:hypothetical protein